MKKTKVCMVVQEQKVKGGIAAVVNGYRGSKLEKDYEIIYVESYKDGNRLEKLLKGIRGYFYFICVIIRKKPDLIHIHSSFGTSFYRKVPFIYMASMFKIPIINHIHGADFNEFYVRASDKKKRYIKKVYDKCNKLIALSSEWEENLNKIVDKKKIEIIENYSVLHEDALEERMHRSSNNQVIFLGELGQRKGCFDIPEIIKEVVKKVPNVKFVLCGSGSKSDVQNLKNKIKINNVCNNVVFPGWVRGNEKDKLLRESDLFLLPSYNEGMPMSILDAMGYGLPIISTNVGGISKIVINKENGICCKPGDISCMAEGIVSLLQNKNENNIAGKKSIDIIKKGYSLERHLELLESLYERVVKYES